MVKTAKNSADYILPLFMNGLSGRMLKLPAKKAGQREILLIYGHHSSIERMMGLAEYLNRYGSVTMPDLPGFGGMESFYKIGQKPTIDSLADYLAAFIKLRYRSRKFTIVGLSLGFPIITRMLQKYPELVKQVDLLASVVGFAHRDDIVFKRSTYWFFRILAKISSYRVFAFIGQHLILRPINIRLAYKLVESKNPKLKDVSPEIRKQRIDFEIKLWRINDFRTYAQTSVELLTLKPAPRHVDLPVHHVAIDNDRYFDNVKVEEHLRMIYSDFILHKSKLPIHAPSVMAEVDEVIPLIPSKLKALLRKTNRRKN